MLKIHRSHRMEDLVADYLKVLAEPPPKIGKEDIPEAESVFREDFVAVQSEGMERWLALETARGLGIHGGVRFTRPRRLMEDLMDRFDGVPARETTGGRPRSGKRELAWHLFARLLNVEKDPDLEDRLAAYLAGDDRVRRTFDLARRLAELFVEVYGCYRESADRIWSDGGTDWQRTLWEWACGQDEDPGFGGTEGQKIFVPFVDRADRFMKRLDAIPPDHPETGRLPSRLVFFGITTLPPIQVRLLDALGRHLDIHLYLLCPSPGYAAALQGAPPGPPDEEDLEAGLEALESRDGISPGHPLHEGLGRQGRSFLRLLGGAGEGRRFEDPPTPDTSSPVTLLERIRRELRDAEPGEVSGLPALRLEDLDDSIMLHACHDRMREVEVLADQLRALLEADPGLAPHEMLVMAPRIEDYAPYIEAVFRGDVEGISPIPFRIADRGAVRESPLLKTLLELLDRSGGRITLPEVFDFLQRNLVKRRFGLDDEAFDRVRAWMIEAGARWGWDAEHRGRSGQPELDANTWRFARRRLLLGYTLPREGTRPFHGVLPLADVEGEAAQAIGSFLDFLDAYVEALRSFEVQRTLDDWDHEIDRVLSGLVDLRGAARRELQRIRDALGDARHAARLAGLEAFEVPVDQIRDLLGDLGEAIDPRGYLDGEVCFCQLTPMRSVPFRVIALLGLDGKSFPRSGGEGGLNRLASRPRLGDRTHREDDRNLFLEALLSARERLIITYQGRNPRDNQERPPSVVVSELTDHLADRIEEIDGEGASEATRDAVFLRLLTEHPLQPFSPRYFDGSDPRRFSFDETLFEGAGALVEGRRRTRRFITGPISGGGGDAENAIPLDELVRFIRGPSRYFLEHVLSVRLRRFREPDPDREPMALDRLEHFLAADEMLTRTLAGESPKTLRERFLKGGEFPPEEAGRALFDHILNTRIRPMLEGTARWRKQGDRPDLEVDFRVAGTRITGRIGHLHPFGRLVFFPGRMNGGKRLGLWVEHLALGLEGTNDGTDRSLWIAYDGPGEDPVLGGFEPVEAEIATGCLKMVIALYRRGLTEPVPLFPKTLFAFSEQVLGTSSQRRKRKRKGDERAHVSDEAPRSAYVKAAGAWRPRNDPYNRGEGDEPENALLFDGYDPIVDDGEPSLTVLARSLIGPLYGHEILDPWEPGK